jgi:Flp pilus assembly protein TadB
MENPRVNHSDTATPRVNIDESTQPSDKAQEEGLLASGLKQVRRLIVLVIGGTVLLAGIVMLVVPGPGLIVIPLGLGILAIEFAWAGRLLRKFKQKGIGLRDFIIGKKKASAANSDREIGP